MDFQLCFNKYLPLILKHRLPLALGLLGLIFFGYGLITLFLPKTPDEIIFETSDNQTVLASTSAQKQPEIVVDIEGGVMKPGVYHLPVNSRIHDGLIAAGGLSSNAQRAWVAKNINLALPLKDGTKIYIPFQGEASNVQGTNTNLTGNTTININTASRNELDTLSGVGEATAQKIIDGRPYDVIEELVEKKAVSKSVFEKIKERITTY